jgi:hypothetical protein
MVVNRGIQKGKILGCYGISQPRCSGHTALKDNLANMVEPLDMFIGGPWVRRDRADSVVGLSHNIEGQRPILAEAKTFNRYSDWSFSSVS